MVKIKVYGPGCAKCVQLDKNVKEAIRQIDVECDYEYVSDIQKILEVGIMMTPALAINDKILAVGKVVPVKNIIEAINKFNK